MSSYTQGEWKIIEGDIESEAGLSIATVYWKCQPYHVTLVPEIEGKANLKLIAASPVLFDALRKINRSEDWKRLSDENQQIILNALHKVTE